MAGVRGFPGRGRRKILSLFFLADAKRRTEEEEEEEVEEEPVHDITLDDRYGDAEAMRETHLKHDQTLNPKPKPAGLKTYEDQVLGL